MRTHNGARFPYLERGSEYQLLGGTEKSHGRLMAAKARPLKADVN